MASYFGVDTFLLLFLWAKFLVHFRVHSKSVQILKIIIFIFLCSLLILHNKVTNVLFCVLFVVEVAMNDY